MSSHPCSRRFRYLSLLTALASALLGATLATSTPAAGAPNQAAAPDVGVAATSFADEFNAPAGTPVDGSKWNMETGDNVNNHERQYYTNSTSNAVQDGQGNLVITARRENPGNYNCWYGRCEYTSARLNTSGKFTQAYGHFETRLKMSRGQGMWPAFWLLGNNIGSVGWPQSGEIDIMENVGNTPNNTYGTIHGPGYSGANGGGGNKTIGSALGDAFHTYAIDWSPNLIIWTLDGQEYFRATPAQIGGHTWVYDHPFSILLNVAVGG